MVAFKWQYSVDRPQAGVYARPMLMSVTVHCTSD